MPRRKWCRSGAVVSDNNRRLRRPGRLYTATRPSYPYGATAHTRDVCFGLDAGVECVLNSQRTGAPMRVSVFFPAFLLACAVAVTACHETGEIKVVGLSFAGNQAFKDGDLARQLVTKKSGWLPWSEPRYFNRERFDADLKRLIAFYTDRGYPKAQIGNVAIDFNEKRDAVSLTIEVVEGEPLRVEQVELKGLDAVAEDVRNEAADIPIKAGTPRDRAVVAANREQLVFLLKDRGYAHARVLMAERPGTDPNAVVVTFTAEPGPLSHFGDTTFVNLQSVEPSVVRRSLTYRTGDLFRESLVVESQRRLAGLGLFEFAHVTPKQTTGNGNGSASSAPDVVPMVVTVTEGKVQKYQFGLGYGTEDGPRGSFEWDHDNFRGRAERLNLMLRYSARLSGGSFDFTEPYVFTRRLSFTARLGAWWTDEPIYSSDQRGGHLIFTFKQQFARALGVEPIHQTIRFGYSNERLSYTVSPLVLQDLRQADQLIALGLDPVLGNGAGRLASVNFDLQRMALDHPFNPRRGYTLSAHVAHVAPWAFGTFRYDEVDGEAAAYLPLGPSLVWATRARAAAIFASDAPQVPFSERYFLGGANSLRGWSRYQVSPLSEEGVPIGGRALIDSSTELRFRLTERFGAVAFLDAGQVFEDQASFGSSKLLLAAGPGIRWYSPVGIVRADVAFQLRRLDGLIVEGTPETRRWRIHFSIGHTF